MKNLQKHFNEITKSKTLTARPVLQCINFNHETNYISACDSHRLLQVQSNVPLETSYNLHVNSLTFSDAPYPNLTRLLPTVDNTIQFSASQLDKNALKIFKTYKNEPILMYSNGNKLFFDNESYQQTLLVITLENEVPPLECYVNSLYLHDVFQFLSEACKENFIYNSIVMTYTSEIRPILFTELDNEKTFNYLITPIRKN